MSAYFTHNTKKDFFYQLNLFVDNLGYFSTPNHEVPDLKTFWNSYTYDDIKPEQLMRQIVDKFAKRFHPEDLSFLLFVRGKVLTNIILYSIDQFPCLQNPYRLMCLLENTIEYGENLHKGVRPQEIEYFNEEDSEEDDEEDNEEDEDYFDEEEGNNNYMDFFIIFNSPF